VVVIEPGQTKSAIWEKGRVAVRQYSDPASPFTEIFQQATQIGSVQTPTVEPVEIAKAIHRALTARKPRIRYRPGMPRLLTTVIMHLPEKWVDSTTGWVFRRQLKSVS